MKREDLILNKTIEEVVLNICTMKLCYQSSDTFILAFTISKQSTEPHSKEENMISSKKSVQSRLKFFYDESQSSQISASGQWEFSDIVKG